MLQSAGGSVPSCHEQLTRVRFKVPLTEDVYCARGDMENRIKECQRDMFADRMPAPPCA